MTETLFGASPTITFPDNAEDTYSMGTRVTFAVAGQITGARIWGTTNVVTSSPSAAIYTTAGVQQVAKAVGAYSTNAWNTVTFDTPFSVSAGATYVIVFGPLNRYAGNSSVFPLTVGNLTGNKGQFVVSGALAYPSSDSGGGGSTWYGIDVLFTATATEVTLDSARAETVARIGTLQVDRNLLGDRSTTFATPTTLGHDARAGGPAATEFTVVGSLAIDGETAPPVSSGNRGWWGFKNIIDEARQEYNYQTSAAPVACPNDGEPLVTAPDGLLFCPFDGWPNV